MLESMSHSATWGKDGRVDLYGILTHIKKDISCFRFRMHLIIMFKEGKMLTDILGNKWRQHSCLWFVGPIIWQFSTVNNNSSYDYEDIFFNEFLPNHE